MQVCKACTSSSSPFLFISSKTNSEFYSRYMRVQARGSGKSKGMQRAFITEFQGAVRGRGKGAAGRAWQGSHQHPTAHKVCILHTGIAPEFSTASHLVEKTPDSSRRARPRHVGRQAPEDRKKASFKVSCRSRLGSPETLHAGPGALLSRRERESSVF